jgi:hypothetical protein
MSIRCNLLEQVGVNNPYTHVSHTCFPNRILTCEIVWPQLEWLASGSGSGNGSAPSYPSAPLTGGTGGLSGLTVGNIYGSDPIDEIFQTYVLYYVWQVRK